MTCSDLRGAMLAREPMRVRCFEPQLRFLHYISAQFRGQIGLFQRVPCHRPIARVFPRAPPPKDDLFWGLFGTPLRRVTVKGTVSPVVEIAATRTNPLSRHLSTRINKTPKIIFAYASKTAAARRTYILTKGESRCSYYDYIKNVHRMKV